MLSRKRGGRVSGTTAVAGTMLNIKPMIQVSEEGKLETVGKVRGKKSAMRQLVSEMKETADIDRCMNQQIRLGVSVFLLLENEMVSFYNHVIIN